MQLHCRKKKKNSFSIFSELPVTFNVMIYDSPCVQKVSGDLYSHSTHLQSLFYLLTKIWKKHVSGDFKCYCNLSSSRPWWGFGGRVQAPATGSRHFQLQSGTVSEKLLFFCCFWTVGIFLQYPEWQRKKLWKSAALFMSAGLTCMEQLKPVSQAGGLLAVT